MYIKQSRGAPGFSILDQNIHRTCNKKIPTYAMILASKRSCSDQPSPTSNLTINDLPDSVLVDILCRLPDNRVVYQCKLVSKRWRTLLSDPYFVISFLRIQHGQQKPLLNRYVMIPEVINQNTLVLDISSEPNLPPLEASISSIFPAIPRLESHYNSGRKLSHKLYVKGTYNDLVLCAQGTSQRVYYMCNCYTKEWIRLPPTAGKLPHDMICTMGLICEPYYNIKEEGTSSNSYKVKLHAEYRFRVVRLITTHDVKGAPGISVEIFSSETGKWRQYSLSRILYEQPLFPNFNVSRGIACNGKLYWLTYQGSTFELDPFNMCSSSTASDDDVIDDNCRFIESPNSDMHASCWHLGVCRGRLQICRRPCFIDRHDDDLMVVWELKENEVIGKPEWCLLHRMSLSEMVCKQPFIISGIVGFHPIDKDIVFLQHGDRKSDPRYLSQKKKSDPRYVVMCNVREKTLEIATKIPSAVSYWDDEKIFANVIPWWPTPVPTRLNYEEEYLNITVIGTGVDIFNLKVGSLSTVEQLIKELEEKRGRWLFDEELQFDGRVLDDDRKWVMDYGIKDSSNIMLMEKVKPSIYRGASLAAGSSNLPRKRRKFRGWTIL